MVELQFLIDLVLFYTSRSSAYLSVLHTADAILEYFLEIAMKSFYIGRVDQTLWHPEYHSSRVVLYVLVKK